MAKKKSPTRKERFEHLVENLFKTQVFPTENEKIKDTVAFPPDAIALVTFTILVSGLITPQKVCEEYNMACKERNEIVERALEELRQLVESPAIYKQYTDQQLDPVKRLFHLYRQV